MALPKEVSKPWEHPVGWGDLKPSCTSKNWKHKDVKLEIGDGIAYLTLNAPERKNSLNFDVQDAFQDACMELHTRKDIRVVVLKAEGSMFCSGGDPKWFQDCAKLPDEENNKGSMQFAKFLYMFQTLPQLTIAMVQGHAMGGGVGLASICDVVIAIKNAQFVLSEVRLGVIPATISPYVVAKIGVANAKRLFCTAENLKAEEARQMGLVQYVCESEDEMKKKLVECCKGAAMCGPEAVAMTTAHSRLRKPANFSGTSQPCWGAVCQAPDRKGSQGSGYSDLGKEGSAVGQHRNQAVRLKVEVADTRNAKAWLLFPL